MDGREPAARHDRGSITAFVVCLTLAFTAFTGLAVDGGRIVGTKITAADHAENAARAGAQELVDLRRGAARIDPGRASARASAYLSAHGVSGNVVATPERVTVTVTMTVRMTILAVVGVGAKRVSATRSSDPVTS